MKLPEFNLFSDKSARICAYVGPEHSTTEMSMRCTANATVSSCLSRQEMCRTWLGNIQRISPSVRSRKL